ncbi:hypothetical protein GQX73_g9944 [Xylaria multiplex]|uniref:Uncharacterized protein n=1 Tax=Xylaria multiplex TaxID=323545 RepID=A0A7C8MM93_9PEZI|nr:hypothetical protein GQX73_g9944 [Xylaria multiplex]
MAEVKAHADGDHSPPTQEASPMGAPPPQLGLEVKLSTPKLVQSPTPRGQRFSKLSDAYFNITSRQGSNSTIRKVSDPSQSSSAGPSLSPLAGPRPAKSQDDLQTPGSASGMRNCVKKDRRASFDSIDLLGDLSPRMGRRDITRLSLSKQIENELGNLNEQSQDTTNSTIEGILAQYDGRISSLKEGYDKSREHRSKAEFAISQPPLGSLPEFPPMDMQFTSGVCYIEYDSPVLDSSVTDSQHLLDAEAQAHELEEARRALVPLPLKLAQPHRGVELSRGENYPSLRNKGASRVYGGESRVYNPFMEREDDSYKTYLQSPIERDISQRLRRVSDYAGYGTSTSHSQNVDEDFAAQQGPPQGEIFSQYGASKASTGEKPLRHIKVVIGREPETLTNSQGYSNPQDDAEDGDWITEATSDAGFGFASRPLSRRPLTGEFKKAGSSLADYSDDDYEGVADRFGSQERIIRYPSSDGKDKSYNTTRSKESKFTALLSRRCNASPESLGHHWGNTITQATGQFRPQILRKDENPFREVSSKRSVTSGRLVFNFDENAPPRYEFRDSVSEYEVVAASTKANCETRQFDTKGSILSQVSDLGKENLLSTTDARFDKSADLDADRNPSGGFSQQNKACQAPPRGQDKGFSIYEKDRREQLKERDERQFASGSSYYDQPSANSVRSKFDFELLSLDHAQQKNKRQRSSGETNETESAAARLKRKQSVRSRDLEKSPLEPPPKAFFTSPDLSLNFSSPYWLTRNLDQDGTPTPFAMGYSNGSAYDRSRKNRKVSSSGTGDNSPSLSARFAARRDRRDRSKRLLEDTNYHPRGKPWCKPRNKPPPVLIVPDDYVSDRANNARQSCFYLLAILSILPFVGVLVLSGAFSEALKWATQGEVDRLTTRQRRFIKWMLLAECIFYTGGVVTVVVYFVVRSKIQN